MIRMIGASCIIAGSGAFGLAMAAAHRRTERQLAILLKSLEYMSCELSYRQTPLPTLCRDAAMGEKGCIPDFFRELSKELEKGEAPDVQVCVWEVLQRVDPEPSLRRHLRDLGAMLGRFDLPGQLRGLDAAIQSAGDALRCVRDGAEERRRSFQTLGLCAGAALAILFL